MSRRRASCLTALEFRSELRRLNLTQSWFAEQTGLDKMTVSHWATGEVVVPQYVYFMLQLLDRLAYRGEVRDVSDQVEAFVRLVTSQTLAPTSHVRDASGITFSSVAPDAVIVVEDRPWQVVWRDPETSRLQETWYCHESGAYRQKRRLKVAGISARIGRRAS